MKWVILDGWGVIYTVGDDVTNLLLPFLRERGRDLTLPQVTEIYYRASAGEISAAEFWREVGLAGEYPRVEQEYLSTRPEMDPLFPAAAKRLAERYGLAMLSNDVGDWSAALRRRFGLDRVLREAVISGDVKLRKPDRRIFELVLKRIGAAPADCVMVDDRPKNIRGASEMGLKTIRFLKDAYEDDYPADAEVRSFAELPDVVHRLMG